MLRPSQRSIEADDERFVVVERLDKPEARFSGDHDRCGQGIGETEVGPSDTGRGDACRWTARVGVNQMVATLGGPRGCYRSGELDDAGKLLGENGSTMPIRKACACSIPPKLAMSSAAFTIAPDSSVDTSAPCTLRGPSLHIARRVDSTGHRPRIEPSIGDSRALAQRSSTSATSGGACSLVISPRRRRLIGLFSFQVLNTASALLEDGPGPCQPQIRWSFADMLLGVDIDGHNSAHDVFEWCTGRSIPVSVAAGTVTSRESELSESGLERLLESGTRIARTGDTLDIRALSLQGLLFEDRDRLLVDRLGAKVPAVVERRDGDLRDPCYPKP